MVDVNTVNDTICSGNQQLLYEIIILWEHRVKYAYETYLSPSNQHLMHHLSYTHHKMYTTISIPTKNIDLKRQNKDNEIRVSRH
jgi:hypothetical protein